MSGKPKRISDRATQMILSSHGVSGRELSKKIQDETGEKLSRCLIKARRDAAGIKGAENPSLDNHYGWRPDVNERTWSGGRSMVRVLINGKSKWRRKNAVLWEAIHGPIPKGMRLVCLGDSSNDDPSNWKLVSRGAAIFAMALGPVKMSDADIELRPSLIALGELRMRINEMKGELK